MRFSRASGKQYKIERSTGSLAADGSLPARCTRAHHFVAGPLARNRSPPLSMHTPFRSHARGFRRGRDGKSPLSVSPETGWMLSHSRSRSQAATSRFRSSARRRRGYRHAGGIPKGRALWLLLHTSGRAEVCPRREQRDLDKLQLSPQNRRQLRFHAAASYIFYLAAVTRYTAACPPSHRPGDRSAAPAC